MSRLLRYEFRMLIDPETILSDGKLFSDLHELQLYTQHLGCPCRLRTFVPDDGKVWRSTALPSLRFETAPRLPEYEPEIAAVFVQSTEIEGAKFLASAALGADCDVVLSSRWSPIPEIVRAFELLHIELLDEAALRRTIEVFMRGHEVPWAFGLGMWQWPFTVFYAQVEPDIRALERLRAAAAAAGLPSRVQENIRSLSLNRWPAIAYTRDKLLFFLFQRRAAKRHKHDLQEFSFELSYFLDHYYLLFWGGLDQACWIVNSIYDLGFTEKDRLRVGIARKSFLKQLEQSAPDVHAEFAEAAFQKWLERLTLIRHYAAHQGFPALAPAFERPIAEPPREQIDKEIDAWPEWQETKEMLGAEMLEAFRSVFRDKWIERNWRVICDAALGIPGEDHFALVAPLGTVKWEYERFSRFILAVSERCFGRLTRTRASDGTSDGT